MSDGPDLSTLLPALIAQVTQLEIAQRHSHETCYAPDPFSPNDLIEVLGDCQATPTEGDLVNAIKKCFVYVFQQRGSVEALALAYTLGKVGPVRGISELRGYLLTGLSDGYWSYRLIETIAQTSTSASSAFRGRRNRHSNPPRTSVTAPPAHIAITNEANRASAATPRTPRNVARSPSTGKFTQDLSASFSPTNLTKFCSEEN